MTILNLQNIVTAFKLKLTSTREKKINTYEKSAAKAFKDGNKKKASKLYLAALDLHKDSEQVIFTYPFHRLEELATQAYKLLNPPEVRQNERFPDDLIRKTIEFGYNMKPVSNLMNMFKGKAVLDFGCGQGLMGVAFLICGAKSYTGVDIQADPDSRLVKNKRLRKKMEFPYSPNELSQLIPRYRIRAGNEAVLNTDDRFDFVTMLSVSEHLMDLENTFRKLSLVFRPGGKLFFSHHNYYCWNGHHCQPRTVEEIEPDNPAHLQLYDWRHVIKKPPPGHYASTSLNQVRIEELREIVEKFYKIENWTLVPTDPDRGSERMILEIRKLLPDFSDEELFTQNVRCIAIPK